MRIIHTDNNGQFMYRTCPFKRIGASGNLVIVGSTTCVHDCKATEIDKQSIDCKFQNEIVSEPSIVVDISRVL